MHDNFIIGRDIICTFVNKTKTKQKSIVTNKILYKYFKIFILILIIKLENSRND